MGTPVTTIRVRCVIERHGLKLAGWTKVELASLEMPKDCGFRKQRTWILNEAGKIVRELHGDDIEVQRYVIVGYDEGEPDPFA